MSFQADRSLRLEVILSSSQPALLEGLDIWLRLGLLSDLQVKELCKKYLTCPLPQPLVTPSTFVPISANSSKQGVAVAIEAESPSRLRQILQSLMAELSVRWLLFLGVFMVVVSSGVLAATQWERFPAFGQYGVLLGYTSIFWGVSFWARKQRNLQLTAQTLQLVTLFLVPVNFWAMDGFRLWGSPVEWLTVAIASVTLTGITILLLKDRPRNLEYSALINYLGLCYLHWGWESSGFPLFAVYLGIVGTAILLIWRYTIGKVRIRKSREIGEVEEKVAEKVAEKVEGEVAEKVEGENFALSPSSPVENPKSKIQNPSFPVENPKSKIGIVVYALAVLLVRAIFASHVEITQIGLAIGICGWLLAWLSQQHPIPLTVSPPFSASNWEVIGGGLLLLGWLVAVGADPAWQAIAVSGLGLWFFWSRLQRFWLRVDLVAILAIALQAIWLFFRLIPPQNQQWLINTAVDLSNSQENPYALLSVVLFPYVICIVVLTDWLYRRQKSELAEFGEAIAFSFGLIFTLISIANPLLRSLNLLASTVILGIVSWRNPRTIVVYLTHISAILTLTSGINYFLPNLNREIWATILLGVTVAEWLFSIDKQRGGETDRPVRTSAARSSAWYIGLSLAGLSYFLFVADLNSDSIWKMLWLMSPVTLTFVASQTTTSRRELASGLSVVALGMVQILTLQIPIARLVGLGMATILMLVNTRYLQHLVAALITVGFGLSFFGFSLWEGVPGFLRLSVAGWFVAFAIAINILWLLRSLLIERSVKAVQAAIAGDREKTSPSLFLLYTRAVDIWAIGLCSLELLLFSLQSLGVYWQIFPGGVAYLTTAVLLMGANLYRSFPNPNNLSVYALAWAFELLVAQSVKLGGGANLELAIANIAIALIILIVAALWTKRHPSALSSIRILPLLYALFGVALRASNFNYWTGVLVLGASIVGLGVGRKHPQWKTLQYLSLAGVSLSLYELVIYQMLQSPGGNPADGLTVLAVVAFAIAFVYRLLAQWLEPYLRLTRTEIVYTAHIHWALGSTLMFGTASMGIGTQPRLTAIGITVSLLLAAYAIVQGRYQSTRFNPSDWVYLGLIEVAGVCVYARLVLPQLSVLDAWLGPIASGIALIFYILPWRNWGWPVNPWKYSAAALPGLTVLVMSLVVNSINLITVAAFYLWLAKKAENVRFTYLSLILIDWAIYRWFWQDLHLTKTLWYVIPIGLSMLYIAQVDRTLKLPEQRENRHNLRLLGIGLICGISLWTEQWTGLVSGILSIFAIFAGLGFRVRAFLYIGTITFLINATVQLVILNYSYSFLKWAIGLIVGIAFIWLAANFETRRSQLVAVVQNWITELQNWE